MEGSEKKLNQFSLHNLREYARKLGVKSPTTLTKKNLIKEIIGVENGKIKPYYSNRGAPPLKTMGKDYENKTNVLLNNLVDKENIKLQRIKVLCEKIIEEINSLT